MRSKVRIFTTVYAKGIRRTIFGLVSTYVQMERKLNLRQYATRVVDRMIDYIYNSIVRVCETSLIKTTHDQGASSNANGGRELINTDFVGVIVGISKIKVGG